MIDNTQEEFRHRLHAVHGDSIEALTPYKRNKDKVRLLCKKCNHEWASKPQNTINKGSGCPECAKKKRSAKKRMTHEGFIEKAKKEMGQHFFSYEILSKYKRRSEKIKVRHKECGYVWDIAPGNFYNAKTCPWCHGRVHGKKSSKEIKKSTYVTEEVFRKRLNLVWGEEYTLVKGYKGVNKKATFTHSECGYTWETLPSTLEKGHGCPKCAGKYKRTGVDFQKDLIKKHNGTLELVSEFKRMKDDVKVKCNICNQTFATNANYLINGDSRGCPTCTQSRTFGEREVKSYLIENHYVFTEQYTEKIAGEVHRFDFAIYKNGVVVGFIEYNGIQHYKPISFWGGEKAFQGQKKRDEIKRKYCKRNANFLIVVPYTVKDIKKFLDEAFKNINIGNKQKSKTVRELKEKIKENESAIRKIESENIKLKSLLVSVEREQLVLDCDDNLQQLVLSI